MTTVATRPTLAPLALRAPSERVLRLGLIAFCVFTALLGRFCFLLRPWDNDAAIFIYMGKMVATGGRLCHDLIDNKFPTVGLVTSILWRVLGTNWPAYIVLQTVLSLGSAWVLGRTAARVAGAHAQLPTALFMVVFLNFTTAVFGGFQLETVQVFFTVIAAAFALNVVAGNTSLIAGGGSPGVRTTAEQRTGASAPGYQGRNAFDLTVLPAFIIGLAAGCGMMLKPTAVGVLLAFALAVGVRRYRIRQNATLFISVAVGLAVPMLGVFSYLFTANLLVDMPELYRQISTYARESVFDAVEWVKPLTALLLLGFPVMIRGFICRRHRGGDMRWPVTPVVTFAIAWLVVETAGVILQRRMYAYHFLPMVPPAALLFGMIPRTNRAGGLAAALLPIALLSVHQACDLIANTRPGETPMPVSRYLIAHTIPGDAVWMDAWPRLILETGLRPASRLPFTFLFTNYDTAGLDYSAGIIADFERTRPRYIILPIPLDQRMQYQIDFIPELNRRPNRRASYVTGWRRIERYTLEHYEKETVIGNDAVYRRR